MALFDEDEEESNEDFMKRLSAQLDSQGPEIDPDSDPLPIEQVVAAPQQPPSAPSVGKSFSMPASDIVRPRPEDVVKQRIADLVKQRQAEREGLVKDVDDADSSIINSILAGISGLGAGIARRDASAAFDSARKIGSSRANRALSEFDKQTQLERQRIGDEREDKVFARGERDDARKESDRLTAQQLAAQKRDPASEASKSAQGIIIDQYGFDPAKAANLSYEIIQELFPHLRFKLEHTYKEKRDEAAKAQHEADQKQKADQFKTTDARVRSEGELNRASRERAAAAAGDQRGFRNDLALLQASRMPPDVRKEVINTVGLKKDLQNIYDQFKNDPDMIGFLNGTINGQKFFGTKAGKKLVADTNAFFDRKRIESTGAAFSPQELEALGTHVIRPTDTLTEFKAKVDSGMGAIDRSLGTLRDFGSGQGYDMSYVDQYLTSGDRPAARPLPTNPRAPKKEEAKPVVEQRTLKDGTVVNVVKQPDGTYKRVK